MKRYFLENEKGERYELNDGISTAFKLTSSLGFDKNFKFEQINNNFIKNTVKINQGKLTGQLTFLMENKEIEFINYIELSKEIKFVQVKNSIEFFMDVELEQFKINKEYDFANPINITLACKSLWYEKKEIVYNISPILNEVRWNYKFNSRFKSYNNRNILFENNGHVVAPIKLELEGYLINPFISICSNEEEIYRINFDFTLKQNEKILYCTKDTDMYIYKQENDGTLTNLFDELDLKNTNFFKLPKGVSEIVISAENDITKAKLIIYVEYEIV